MHIVKRYKGQGIYECVGGWEDTTEESCIDFTEGSGYWKKGTVLEILSMGGVVNTPFAEYKMIFPKSEVLNFKEEV